MKRVSLVKAGNSSGLFDLQQSTDSDSCSALHCELPAIAMKYLVKYICLYVGLPACRPTCLPAFMSFCKLVNFLPICCQRAYLPTCLYVCLPVCLCIYLQANQYARLSIYACLLPSLLTFVRPSVSLVLRGNSQLSFLFLFFAYFKLLMAPSEILTCGVKN